MREFPRTPNRLLEMTRCMCDLEAHAMSHRPASWCRPFYVKNDESGDKDEWLQEHCTSGDMQTEVERRLGDGLLNGVLDQRTIGGGDLIAFIRFDTAHIDKRGGADNLVGIKLSSEVGEEQRFLTANVISPIARELPEAWVDPPLWWRVAVLGTNQNALSDYFPISRFPMMGGDKNNGIAIRNVAWKKYEACSLARCARRAREGVGGGNGGDVGGGGDGGDGGDDDELTRELQRQIDALPNESEPDSDDDMGLLPYERVEGGDGGVSGDEQMKGSAGGDGDDDGRLEPVHEEGMEVRGDDPTEGPAGGDGGDDGRLEPPPGQGMEVTDEGLMERGNEEGNTEKMRVALIKILEDDLSMNNNQVFDKLSNTFINVDKVWMRNEIKQWMELKRDERRSDQELRKLEEDAVEPELYLSLVEILREASGKISVGKVQTLLSKKHGFNVGQKWVEHECTNWATQWLGSQDGSDENTRKALRYMLNLAEGKISPEKIQETLNGVLEQPVDMKLVLKECKRWFVKRQRHKATGATDSLVGMDEAYRLGNGNTLIKGHGDGGLGHPNEDVDWTGVEMEQPKEHQTFYIQRARPKKPRVKFIALSVLVIEPFPR